MNRYKNSEILVGIFMILALASVLFTTVQTTSLSLESNRANSFEIFANFTEIGGLKVRSPVKLAGVKIGEVNNIILDQSTYEAHVSCTIKGEIKIPMDSSISILTDGLLGSKYLSIKPGMQDQYMQSGDGIMKTYSAVIIEETLSKALSMSSNSEN